MALPNFVLDAVHLKDLVADEPAIAPAWARVALGADDFLLRLCTQAYGNRRLFFRVDLADSPVLYVVDSDFEAARKLIDLLIQGDEVLPSLFEEVRWTRWQQELPELLRQTLADFNWERRFTSFLSLPLDEPMAIEGREALLFSHQVGYDSSSLFLAPENRALNDEDLEMRIEAQFSWQISLWMKQPNSECALAYQWSELPSEQQVSSLLIFENGSWNSYVLMLKYLAWLQPLRWKGEAPARWRLDFAELPRVDPLTLQQKMDIYRLEIDGWAEMNEVMPAAMKKCVLALHEHFDPSINWLLKNVAYRHRNLSQSELLHHLEVKPPTSAHQRLEAQLQLRDFLRDKVSPDELAALMSES